MQSMRAYRHIGLFAAVAMLAASATPALAVDNDAGTSAKDKKAAAAQHKAKSRKAKQGSTMSKETVPAYPNLGAPTGY